MAPRAHSMRPTRSGRMSRNNISYREPKSDDEISDGQQYRKVVARSSTRVQRQSYNEDSSSSGESTSTSESHSNTSAQQFTTSFLGRKRKRKLPEYGRIPNPLVGSSLYKKRKIGRILDTRGVEGAVPERNTPPWQELEYQILVQVMKVSDVCEIEIAIMAMLITFQCFA